MKHVHKYTKDLVSVIITIVTNIIGGDTIFNDVVKSSYLGNRTYVLKYLPGKMFFGPFEK